MMRKLALASLVDPSSIPDVDKLPTAKHSLSSDDTDSILHYDITPRTFFLPGRPV